MRAPQRPTMRRSICAARPLSISCSTTAQASASQGQGRRRGRRQGSRRIAGPSSGSRRKRRKKSPRSSSTPRAKRIRSAAVSRSAGPASLSSLAGGRRDGDGRRVDPLGSHRDPLPARFPGPDEHRRRVDDEQAGRDPAANPHHEVPAAVAGHAEGGGRPDLELQRSRAQPALSGRAGGRRQGTSGWRGRCGRSDLRRERRRGERPREPTARTAATVATPAMAPPAAASAAVRTSVRSTGTRRLAIGIERAGRLTGALGVLLGEHLAVEIELLTHPAQTSEGMSRSRRGVPQSAGTCAFPTPAAGARRPGSA